MNQKHLIGRGLLHALGVVAYIGAVAWFLSSAKTIFGEAEDKFLIPVFMLLLFVISATVTGLLVLGKPLALYTSGLRREGLALLGMTVGWLAIFLCLVGITLSMV